MLAERRSFLGRLVAGGFGLAVGTPVAVEVASPNLIQASDSLPALLPPLGSDLQVVILIQSRPVGDQPETLTVTFEGSGVGALRQYLAPTAKAILHPGEMLLHHYSKVENAPYGV